MKWNVEAVGWRRTHENRAKCMPRLRRKNRFQSKCGVKACQHSWWKRFFLRLCIWKQREKISAFHWSIQLITTKQASSCTETRTFKKITGRGVDPKDLLHRFQRAYRTKLSVPALEGWRDVIWHLLKNSDNRARHALLLQSRCEGKDLRIDTTDEGQELFFFSDSRILHDKNTTFPKVLLIRKYSSK